MAFILQPWQLLVTILAALTNHYQQQVNDFQRVQIETLLESQGKQRQVIVDLVLRLAKENPCWGFDRIQAGLANVGYHVSEGTVGQFLLHYHQERNHQGLGNKIIEPNEEVGRGHGEIECRERLGGLLRYYHRKAA